MLDSLFKALAAGLSIWDHKEKTKYVDRLLGLKRDWDSEYAKEPDIRDDAVLDNIERQLRILTSEWTAIVGAQNS